MYLCFSGPRACEVVQPGSGAAAESAQVVTGKARPTDTQHCVHPCSISLDLEYVCECVCLCVFARAAGQRHR